MTYEPKIEVILEKKHSAIDAQEKKYQAVYKLTYYKNGYDVDRDLEFYRIIGQVVYQFSRKNKKEALKHAKENAKNINIKYTTDDATLEELVELRKIK